MIARHPLISATVWGQARRGLQHVRPGLHHRSSHHINTSPHSPPLHTFAAPKNFTLISFVSKKRILMDLVLSLKLFKWQCLCEMLCQLLSRNLVSTAPGCWWRCSLATRSQTRVRSSSVVSGAVCSTAALQGSHCATTCKYNAMITNMMQMKHKQTKWWMLHWSLTDSAEYIWAAFSHFNTIISSAHTYSIFRFSYLNCKLLSLLAQEISDWLDWWTPQHHIWHPHLQCYAWCLDAGICTKGQPKPALCKLNLKY